MAEQLIIGKNTAHDYTLESAYYSYLENRIQQELRINQLISECSILNEANTGIITKTKKIAALHEAGMGDKIKAGFKKFIEFCKNIFGKFMANMTKILADEKTYLDKYRDIITKRPGSSEIDVSYYGNYEKGIDRITKTHIAPFDWNKVKDTLKADETDVAYSAFFKNPQGMVEGLDGFTYDQNEDLKAQLKEYFIGGEDGQQEKKMSDMPLKSMFDFCYDFEAINKNFKKDLNAIESSTNKINNAINQAEVPNTVANTVEDTEKTDGSKGQDTKGSSDATTGHLSSAIDHNFIGGFFNEAGPKPEAKQTDNKDNEPQTNTNLNVDTTKVSQATGTVDRLNAEDEKKNAETQVGNAMKDQQGKDNSAARDAVGKIVNKYQNIANAIVTAKMTACEQICKDYMKIMNIHVKSQVGKSAEAGGGKTNGKTYTRDQYDDNGKLIKPNKKQQQQPKQQEEGQEGNQK